MKKSDWSEKAILLKKRIVFDIADGGGGQKLNANSPNAMIGSDTLSHFYQLYHTSQLYPVLFQSFDNDNLNRTYYVLK